MSLHARVRWFVRPVLVLWIALAAGCPGGEEEDGDEEVGILGLYHFRLGGPLAGGAGPSALQVSSTRYQVTARMDLSGSVLCDQETEVCWLQTVEPGSTLHLDDETVPELVGDFSVTVDDLWVFNPLYGDRPTGGDAHVDPEAPGLEDVTLSVRRCEQGNPGVRVSTASGGWRCYPWAELDALLDGEPSAVEAFAALGMGAMELTLAQASHTLETFSFIGQGAFAGTLPCDAYAASWPGGPSNPGWLTLSWTDEDQSGSAGPGDSFRRELHECWRDDPASDVDTLLDGALEFIGYTEVVDGGMIRRIGFEGETRSSRAGGVAYHDLAITETVEAGGAIGTEPPVVLNGQHVIVFWE